jgi:Na/Pi-cotransporter
VVPSGCSVNICHYAYLDRMFLNWTLPAIHAVDWGAILSDFTADFHSTLDETQHAEAALAAGDMDGFHVLASILGGVALLSYSMSLMSRGLRTAFGASFREAIKTACSHKFLAFFAGTVTTAVLTSATATSFLVLQFVQAGDMTFAQSLGVMLGINVGSTLNAHLMAFQLHRYGLLLVGVGYIMHISPVSHRVQWLGESVLGLGLLFVSIMCMADGIAPLQKYKPFLGVLAHMSNPAFAMLASGVCAIIFQSSNTVIALAILLGSQGFISLEVGLYFVLGSNVGKTRKPFVLLYRYPLACALKRYWPCIRCRYLFHVNISCYRQK